MDFEEFFSGVKKTVDNQANEQSEETEMQKLYKAVSSRRAKVAKTIIDNGLSTDERDLSGNTLLHSVILNEESPDVIKLVVELGFDVNATNGRNWSPLYLVRKYLKPSNSNKEIHSWLVSQGAIAKPDILSEPWAK